MPILGIGIASNKGNIHLSLPGYSLPVGANLLKEWTITTLKEIAYDGKRCRGGNVKTSSENQDSLRLGRLREADLNSTRMQGEQPKNPAERRRLEGSYEKEEKELADTIHLINKKEGKEDIRHEIHWNEVPYSLGFRASM